MMSLRSERRSGMRRIDVNEAVALMREAGLDPLMPYPGAKPHWLCRCVRCGNEVSPSFQHVKSGKSGGCRHCVGLAPLDPASAVREALERGYRSVENYPGSVVRRWKCEHLACGSVVYVRLRQLRRGGGCCRLCATRARIEQNRSKPKPPPRPRKVSTRPPDPRRDPQRAVEVMLAAQLKPLSAYPGSNVPWRCICLRCGMEVLPRLLSVKQGHGCRFCGFRSTTAKQRLDPVRVDAEMRDRGYLPQEAYPGASTPWHCIHEPCGRPVRARLTNLRMGGGCCSYCAKHGFDSEAPAILYLLHHRILGAVKIGITGMANERLKKFRAQGWEITCRLLFPRGDEARKVEREVLSFIRGEMGLQAYLTAKDIPHMSGWTETFDADLLPPDKLYRIVQNFRNGENHGKDC